MVLGEKYGKNTKRIRGEDLFSFFFYEIRDLIEVKIFFLEITIILGEKE